MAVFAGVRLHLFFCVLLPCVSNPWAHRAQWDSTGERLSSSRNTDFWTRTGDMVCAYRAVVFERSAHVNGVVLGRDGRFIVISAESVAARHVGDLFCVLFVFCERGAGFFRLPVGRHAARSGIYFSFLRAVRAASWFWAVVTPVACQSVPVAMGMVSHLLRICRGEDDGWRSGVAAFHGDGRILSERSAAHVDRLVHAAFTALGSCFNRIRYAGAGVGFGVDAIFAAALAHRVFLYCDSMGAGSYIHRELHFFELPGAGVGSLAAR